MRREKTEPRKKYSFETSPSNQLGNARILQVLLLVLLRATSAQIPENSDSIQRQSDSIERVFERT